VDRHLAATSTVLRERIERAQASGLLPSMSLASAYYMTVGAAGLVFSQAPECRRLFGVDPSDPAFVRAHADAVVRLLLGER
jgi:hypothetical protein